jgi:hypothetical protein
MALHWFLIMVGCGLVGCGFQWNYKSSQAALGPKQHPHYQKFDIPGLTIHVRPLNDIRTFYMAYFVILPIDIETKDVPQYEPVPFRAVFAFLPHKAGFSFKPEEMTLRIEGKDLGPSSLSVEKAPVSDPQSDFYRKEVARGRVFCDDRKPTEYIQVTGDTLIKLEKIEKWHCFEVIFDLPSPSPETEFSILIDGIFHNGSRQEVPPVPFRESQWSRSDSVP